MAVVKLADICQKIGSGATPRGGKEAYRAEGIALVKADVFEQRVQEALKLSRQMTNE